MGGGAGGTERAGLARLHGHEQCSAVRPLLSFAATAPFCHKYCCACPGRPACLLFPCRSTHKDFVGRVGESVSFTSGCALASVEGAANGVAAASAAESPKPANSTATEAACQPDDLDCMQATIQSGGKEGAVVERVAAWDGHVSGGGEARVGLCARQTGHLAAGLSDRELRGTARHQRRCQLLPSLVRIPARLPAAGARHPRGRHLCRHHLWRGQESNRAPRQDHGRWRQWQLQQHHRRWVLVREVWERPGGGDSLESAGVLQPALPCEELSP